METTVCKTKIDSIREMIKCVSLCIVSPGNQITDASGVKYIKMEGASTALRMRDGKVILLSCIPYPITISKFEE